MLTPVFSLANMRELLPVIQPIADKMRDVLLGLLPPGDGERTPPFFPRLDLTMTPTLTAPRPADAEPHEIDLVPWMSRGTLEYVCQANLGYTFHALEPDRTNEYATAVRNLSCAPSLPPVRLPPAAR